MLYASVNFTTSLFAEKFLACVTEKSLFPTVQQNRSVKNQQKDYNTQNYNRLLKQDLEI